MDTKKLKAKRDILEKSAEVYRGFALSTQKEIDKIKSQLAAEPELRHGDYNIKRQIMVKVNQNMVPYWCDFDGTCVIDDAAEGLLVHVDGNACDDIITLQEDVFQFEENCIKVTWNSGGDLEMQDNGEDVVIVIRKHLPAFILGLRRMLATQQRKAAK